MENAAPLVTLQKACLALQNGDAKAAIVAGIDLTSCENPCTASGAQGDGAHTGGAVSAMYIKPLHDAIRNGDPIRAIIRAAHNDVGSDALNASVEVSLLSLSFSSSHFIST